MIVAALLALFLIATLVVSLGWRGTGRWLQMLTVIIFWLIGSGIVSPLLLKPLQKNLYYQPNWQSSHEPVIVLLGGGIVPVPGTTHFAVSFFSQGRVSKAAMLYRECQYAQKGCQLIISGGDPQYPGISEAVIYREALQALGVPSRDIILEDKSRNTWQNAQFTADILKKDHFDTVYLVSSEMHLARSRQYFEHFGIHPILIAADYFYIGKFSWIPRAYQFAMTDLLLHEYVGMARYYVYNWLGWNNQI